jgi:hypothetical protein
MCPASPWPIAVGWLAVEAPVVVDSVKDELGVILPDAVGSAAHDVGALFSFSRRRSWESQALFFLLCGGDRGGDDDHGRKTGGVVVALYADDHHARR